jgi:hypothetical protein
MNMKKKVQNFRKSYVLVYLLLFLSASIAVAQTTVTLGSGTLDGNNVTDAVNIGDVPYGLLAINTYYHDNKVQYLIRASEITAAGGHAGTITSLSLYVVSQPGMNMSNFNISMGTTALTTYTSPWSFESVPTLVYSRNPQLATDLPSDNWRMFTFDNGFCWDGTSNIIVQICFDNTSYASGGNIRLYQPTGPYTPAVHEFLDGQAGCSMANIDGHRNTYRAQMKLTIALPPTIPVVSNNGPINCNNTANLTASGLAPGGKAATYTGAQTGGGSTFTSINNTFSVDFWVKPGSTIANQSQSNSNTNGTSSQRYAIFPANGGTNAGMGVSVGTNGIQVYEHGNSYMPPLLVYMTPVSSTTWTHITVVYNNRVPSLYVNGALVATGLTSGRATVYPSYGTGGTSPGYGSFIGSIDNYRIWNGILTQADIGAISMLESSANSPSGRTVLGRWSFNSTVSPSTGSGDWDTPSSYSDPLYYTYTWTGAGAPTPSTNETQTTASLNSTRSFTVKASVGAGCEGPASVATEVTVICCAPPASVSISLQSGANPLCAGGAITLSAGIVGGTLGGGSWEYQWELDGGGGVLQAWSNSSTYTNASVPEGNYNIIVRVRSSACSGAVTTSAVYALTASPYPTVAAMSDFTVCYSGGAIALSGPNTYTNGSFAWSSINGSISGSGINGSSVTPTNQTPNGQPSVTATLTVTGTGGCSAVSVFDNVDITLTFPVSPALHSKGQQ